MSEVTSEPSAVKGPTSPCRCIHKPICLNAFGKRPKCALLVEYGSKAKPSPTTGPGSFAVWFFATKWETHVVEGSDQLRSD